MEVESPSISAAPSIMCTACRQEVVGLEARREHYRSDLHRVNLKRKVTGLGPLTPTEFSTRVTQLEHLKLEKEQSSGRRARRSTSGAFVCEPCCKRFSSSSALANHERSRRHQDTVRRVAKNGMEEAASELSASVNGDPHAEDDPMDAQVTFAGKRTGPLSDRNASQDDTTATEDDMNDDDDDAVDDDDKLAMALDAELARRLAEWSASDAHRRSAFDDEELESAEEALEYMQKKFGFFVPFRERLVDKDGLVRYINQKVGVGFACIACDKGFACAEDAQRHMIDVGHCRMPSEEDVFLEEFGEFYDFGGASTSGNGGDGDEEDGWEEVNEQEDIDDKAVIVSNSNEANALVAVDEGRSMPIGALELGETDDGREEMVGLSLGGGKVVGHRSLVRFYKQASGRRVDERAAVIANRASTELAPAKWRKGDHFDVKSLGGRAAKRALRRHQRFELLVGQQNYYVRKSRFKQSFAVFNSGYRA